MNKYFFAIIIILISLSALAQEEVEKRPRHMVMITTQGFGFGGSAEDGDTKGSSPFKGSTIDEHNFALNYAYTITDRIQLGAFFKQSRYTNNVKTKSGDDADIDEMTNSFGVYGIYNFSDDLYTSYYLGFMVASINREENYGRGFTEAEEKQPFELDDKGSVYQIYFGKRFSLKRFGIQNITYSPQIALYSRTYGKDFSDQGFDKGKGIIFDVVRFDVLF